jgi:hypothetical protein
MSLSLHEDNCRYNIMLSRSRAKVKRKSHNWRLFAGMNPKEVISALQALGLSTTDRTLRQYVKDGLIDPPVTKGAGQGKGKIADYPQDTPAQFFASWWLRNNLKIKPELIIDGKKFKAMTLRNDPDGYAENEKERKLFEIGVSWDFYYSMAEKWHDK